MLVASSSPDGIGARSRAVAKMPALTDEPDSAERRRSPAGACSAAAPRPRPAPCSARVPGAGRRHTRAASARAPRRRRDRRRRLRRADRGPRARAQGALGDRARGPRPRRRPRPQRRHRRRRDHRARRHLRRPDPGPRASRWRGDAASASSTTYNTGDNVYIADGPRLRLRRHRPDRHGAARPGDPRRPRAGRHRPRRDVDDGPGRRAVGRRRAPPSGTPQTLEQPASTRTALTPQFKALVPIATRPIFGAEPRELSLLYVALLHRLLGQRAEPRAPSSATSTPATAPRCGASSAARS